MKICILGTGMVGLSIAGKLLELGHEIEIGTRNSESTRSYTKVVPVIGQSVPDWLKDNPGVVLKSFPELNTEADLIINATGGMVSLEVLKACPAALLEGKTLLDISNPLDYSDGFPPTLSVCNNDSLAEQIQAAYPATSVVKSLNTMNCSVMVNPRMLKGEHFVFLSGNSSSAKAEIASLLESFGWRSSDILDLGDIRSARATEMWLPLWLRIYKVRGNAAFNLSLAD